MRPLWPLVSLALSCGGDRAVDCATAAAFTACEMEDSEGICLEGACTGLAACDAACEAGVTFPLPDTGLRDCFGPVDGPIVCPGEAGAATCAETAGCGQDAQYGWDTTHDRAERFAVVDPTGERVVTDTLTGLVWQGCALGQGPGCAGESTRSPWAEAAAACEASTWGGHDDWVLPDVYAASTIADYGFTSPAIDRDAFPNAPSRVAGDDEAWWKDCAWTATDSADAADVAWGVMANSGDVLLGSGVPYHAHDKAAAGWDGCDARCVRARPGPTHARHATFDVAGERLVVDTYAQRTWQACSVGQTGPDCVGEAAQLPWPDALAACEASTWGGHDDWRLPSVLELRSLVDVRFTRPAIEPTLFPNTPFYDGLDNLRGQYWSSTARGYQTFALYVSFHDGGSHFYRQEEGRHVRCVR